MMIHGAKEDPILQVPGQEATMSSKYGLDTILIMLESLNLAHMLIMAYNEAT